MQSRIPWFWILLALLVLLVPGPAGRVLLDVLGGLTLTILLLPLLAGGAAWLAWQLLQRRLQPCSACGFRSAGLVACPACGHPFDLAGSTAEIEASQVTITVEAVDVDADSDVAASD
ncbi:MAG: hypothetical protein VKI83_08590 [Synechococcaceae cyanobacterium]|nr:hypothetical protein [Synechococcaceae cyanobacterium]